MMLERLVKKLSDLKTYRSTMCLHFQPRICFALLSPLPAVIVYNLSYCH